MLDGFWFAIAIPLLGGLALSFAVERLLQPAPPTLARAPAALAIHAGLWLILFVFELIQFRRPYFASAIVLSFVLFLVLVGNAKFHSLREAFVFQDFEYFIDALRHPRLYLPFLGIWRALAAIVAFAVAMVAGLTLEPSLTAGMPVAAFFGGAAALTGIAAALLVLGSRGNMPLSYRPDEDARRLGLAASLWRYAAEERRRPLDVAAQSAFSEPLARPPADLPDLVVVQSESFADIRRLFAGIRPEVLREFDALRDVSLLHGSLRVPAWGANTVRSEFAFLSGIAEEAMGVHRFNPYRVLARSGVPTLAGHLRGLGYRTVCVHPYPAGFYARDRVFPLLGFDEFVDIAAFADAERAGPYVGDAALADRVCAMLAGRADAGRQPLFLYVITMENHGPLHLERVAPGDVERLYAQPPPPDCEDLTIYLRHLANADRMIGTLRRCLDGNPRGGWLCFFGDHVPIMPRVYAALGVPDGSTDYAIWKAGGGPARRLAMNVENLGITLLREMGLLGEPAGECAPPG